MQISTLLTDEEAAHLTSAAGINASSGDCWLPRRYDRVIWVVIDALRFDFARWIDDGGTSGPTAFYHNKLPVLHEVLMGGGRGNACSEHKGSKASIDGNAGGGGADVRAADQVGGHQRHGDEAGCEAGAGDGTRWKGRALLYKFEADPPTVTMQVHRND